MAKTTKISSKFLWFAKLIAILLFVAMLYSQRNRIEQIQFDSIRTIHWKYVGLAFVLMPLNWFFEYQKWKKTLLVLHLNEPKTSLASFLSGIFSAFITPNFIGNFIGRMFYYPYKKRPAIIVNTLLANYSQFLTTITIGLIPLIFLQESNLKLNATWILISCTFITSLWISYFSFEKWPIKNRKWKQLTSLFTAKINSLRFNFLWNNIARYAVFSLQYLLLLNAFQLEFSFDLYASIVIIYFWSTLIPSVVWGKIFVRETVAIVILTSQIPNTSQILIASLSLWLINQLIPAVIGIPYLLKINKK